MNEFYLGCDISKGYGDFIIMDSKKNIVESAFQLDETFEGHNELINVLTNFFKSHPNSIIYAGVESTGGLENNWLNLFYKLGNILNIKAARINPVGPFELKKASLERNSTDSISAKYIAQYLMVYPEKVRYNEDDPYASLRKQWNLIEMFTKQKTQLLNQLSITIYNAFPFLVQYCKYGVPNWLLQLLSKYPTASKLARAHAETIQKIPYISRTRAQKLINYAKVSIGSADDEVTARIILNLVEHIFNLKETITKLKKQLVKQCDLPEVKLLTTFKGIGVHSAIGLVLNIISIERFPSAKHLASYFGIHPVFIESGDRAGGFHMSKRGRAVPRSILFMVARYAISNNPLIKEVYLRQRKKGKSKMSAIGICMHKITRIIYGMLKNNTEFDPEIDKKNNYRSKQKRNKKIRENAKRRFQKEADDAPISRRKSKNRKKEKQPHPENIENSGVLTSPSSLLGLVGK